MSGNRAGDEVEWWEKAGQKRRYSRRYEICLTKSRLAMIFPLPVRRSHPSVEKSVRDFAIDVGCPPPSRVKLATIGAEELRIAGDLSGSRNFPASRGRSLEVALVEFATPEAAKTFVYERTYILIDESRCYLHLLEAFPAPIYPVPRILSSPSLARFRFLANPLLAACAGTAPSPLNSSWWVNQPISSRERVLCRVPLQWECVLCEHKVFLSEADGCCGQCGAPRTVLSLFQLDEQAVPPELEGLLFIPLPTDLRRGMGDLVYSERDDLYLAGEDSATSRLIFFTKEGHFYSLFDHRTLVLTYSVCIAPAHAPNLPKDLIPLEMTRTDAVTARMSEANADLLNSVLVNAPLRSSVRTAPDQEARASKAARIEVATGALRLPITVKAPQVPALTALSTWTAAESIPGEFEGGARPRVKGVTPTVESVAEIRSKRAGGGTVIPSVEEEPIICFACLRQFADKNEFRVHEEKSELHKVR